jgi:tetratricopeptide (TPR) repeat protein
MIRWKWLLALLILTGCGNNDKGNPLEQPPFAALTDSIQKFPGNTGLLVKRAELLSQHDLHELAYQDYKKAWETAPSEQLAMAYVSNLFLVSKPGEAVAILEQSVREHPDNPDFRRRLSEAYLQTGRSQEALAQYDNMIRADSSNFEAWFEKAMLLVEMKDTAAAVEALARSYQLQPLTMNGLALANLYAETKNPLAVTIADELLMKDTTAANLDPVFIKGVYYSNTRQYPQALEEFEKCIRTNWKFTDAYIEKGIILYEQKNIDEALQTFKFASTVSATNPDAYYWQGRCYELAGKNEDAMDNYLRAYALDKQFVQARDGIERMRKK